MRKLFLRSALKALPSWLRWAKSKSDVPQVVAAVVSPTRGLPLSDAEFRAIAGLPAKTRRGLPTAAEIKQGPKDPSLEAASKALMPLVLANLNRANSTSCDASIPVLLDDDPVYWDDVGAEAADALAAAAIARAMTPSSPPFVSAADDGRVLVLDSGWTASRDASGKWARGIAFTADDLKDDFTRAPEPAASVLASDARRALQ